MRRIGMVLIAFTGVTWGALACGDSGGSGGNGGNGGSGGSGGSGAQGECAVGHCDAGGACTQWSVVAEQQCTAATGTWSSGPCTDHGVGGCRSTSGGGICAIVWYPASIGDAAALKEACEMGGHGTWVEP